MKRATIWWFIHSHCSEYLQWNVNESFGRWKSRLILVSRARWSDWLKRTDIPISVCQNHLVWSRVPPHLSLASPHLLTALLNPTFHTWCLTSFRFGLNLHHAGEAEGEDHSGPTPACHGPRQRPHRCLCGGEISLNVTQRGFIHFCRGFVFF